MSWKTRNLPKEAVGLKVRVPVWVYLWSDGVVTFSTEPPSPGLMSSISKGHWAYTACFESFGSLNRQGEQIIGYTHAGNVKVKEGVQSGKHLAVRLAKASKAGKFRMVTI